MLELSFCCFLGMAIEGSSVVGTSTFTSMDVADGFDDVVDDVADGVDDVADGADDVADGADDVTFAASCAGFYHFGEFLSGIIPLPCKSFI